MYLHLLKPLAIDLVSEMVDFTKIIHLSDELRLRKMYTGLVLAVILMILIYINNQDSIPRLAQIFTQIVIVIETVNYYCGLIIKGMRKTDHDEQQSETESDPIQQLLKEENIRLKTSIEVIARRLREEIEKAQKKDEGYGRLLQIETQKVIISIDLKMC